MSLGHTYKFFGFYISYTILTLPLSIFYLPFMLLILCTFPPLSPSQSPIDDPFPSFPHYHHPSPSDHCPFVLFFIFYYLCYYSCPIPPPHSTPACPPPPSHIPPYSSCPWVILISSLASTFPILFLPSPYLFSTYHLCYLFSEPTYSLNPPLSPSHSPVDNPPCDLHFCDSVPVLVVC